MPTKGEIPDDGHEPNPDKDRCTGTNQLTGERCRNPAAPGFELCQIHIHNSSKADPEPDTGIEPEPEPIPVWERQ